MQKHILGPCCLFAFCLRFCFSGTVFAAQAQSLLDRRGMYCTGTVSAAQATKISVQEPRIRSDSRPQSRVTAARALYPLHRHCICRTGTVSAAQALYLLHITSHHNTSPHSTSQHSTCAADTVPVQQIQCLCNKDSVCVAKCVRTR